MEVGGRGVAAASTSEFALASSSSGLSSIRSHSKSDLHRQYLHLPATCLAHRTETLETLTQSQTLLK